MFKDLKEDAINMYDENFKAATKADTRTHKWVSKELNIKILFYIWYKLLEDKNKNTVTSIQILN